MEITTFLIYIHDFYSKKNRYKGLQNASKQVLFVDCQNNGAE
jgi:hypothetical protein